jgi:hypothetical protein
MSTKTAVWIGMFVGSTLGSMLPYLWSGGVIAYIFWSGVGAIAGMILMYKLAN